MIYLASFLSLLFYKQGDSHSLPDVKDIFVFRSIRAFLFLEAVAVEIEDIYLVEAFHERLAHTSERGIIQITVIGDKPQNAFSCLVNLPLGKSDELYIIILQPFWVFLLEPFSIYDLVIFY